MENVALHTHQTTRELSSFLSPSVKDRYKKVVSPPRTSLFDYSPPPPPHSNASTTPPIPRTIPSAQLQSSRLDFTSLLDVALDVALEGNIQDRKRQQRTTKQVLDEDDFLSEILHDVKLQNGRIKAKAVKVSLPTPTSTSTPPKTPPRTPPKTPPRATTSTTRNVQLSPVGIPSMRKAGRIVLDGKNGEEELDKDALRRALARMLDVL